MYAAPRSTGPRSPDHSSPEHHYLGHRPHEPRRLDHIIAQKGGTTCAIDLLPSRLREAKYEIPSLTTRLEELTKENGRLREEAACHEKVRDSFIQFYSKTLEAYRILHLSISELSGRLVEAENELADYWGFSIDETQQEDVTLI